MKMKFFTILMFMFITCFTWSQTSIVPTEVTITGEGDESFLLDGTSVHYDFSNKLEMILRERIVKSAQFIVNSSSVKSGDLIFSRLNLGQYSFLLLLNSLAEGDEMMIDILLTVLNSMSSVEQGFSNEWLEKNFNLPIEKLYNALHFISNTNIGKPIPKYIVQKLLLTNKTNAVFEEACNKDDIEFIKWFIDSGFNLYPVGPDATKSVWQNGHMNITKLLMSKGSLNNIPKTRAVSNARNKYNETLLHFAIESGDIDASLELLKAHADINAMDKNKKTPLYNAVETGSHVLFTILLKHGAIFNNESASKDNLLHLAVRKGNIEIVKKLVALEADIDCENSSGHTPLYTAIVRNDTAMINTLIERGANINAKTRSGESLIHLAVMENNDVAVKVLLDSGSPTEIKNSHGFTPLLIAAQKNYAEIISILVNEGANVNVRTVTGDTPVHIAASKNNIKALHELIKLGAAINVKNKKGDTSLYQALDANKIASANVLASKLLSTVCNTDEQGNTLLHIAASDGKLNVVRLFVDHDMQIDAKNNDDLTPLYMAAQHGNTEIMKFLLDRSANLYAVNRNGWLMLHYAMITTQDLAARSLIEVGFAVDRTAKWKYTALHLAVQGSSSSLAHILLNNGANPNARDHDNKTPLYEGTWYGHLENVKLLIHKGADPNVADVAGWIPLHIAARFNYIELGKYLLEIGSELDKGNMDNKTPLYEAVWYKNQDFVKMLLEKGASPNILTKDGESPLLLAKRNQHLAGYTYLYKLMGGK